MKERPILFSAPMVRAILSGRKTQTRRVVKELPCQCDAFEPDEIGWQMLGHSGRWWCRCCTSEQDAKFCPYGKRGDRLWVKETWSNDALCMYPCPPVWYRASDSIDRNDGHTCPKESRGRYADCLACWEERECRQFKWKPSIFMPRQASRITLEIVGVRVERLQDISEADAVVEGIDHFQRADEPRVYRDYLQKELHYGLSAVGSYRTLWQSINGLDSWAANPWVWVVEFKRL